VRLSPFCAEADRDWLFCIVRGVVDYGSYVSVVLNCASSSALPPDVAEACVEAFVDWENLIVRDRCEGRDPFRGVHSCARAELFTKAINARCFGVIDVPYSKAHKAVVVRG